MELVAGASLAERLRELAGRPFARLSAADLLGSAAVADEASSTGSSTGSARVTTSWVDACVRVVKRIADALEHAHEHGVFHRDVKPSNVLIDEHGRPRLLDFGLARLQEGQELTQSNAQLGSLPYIPPEVLEGKLNEYRPAQDTYCLGATLYELLTLASPFLGPTAAETRRRIIAGQPARPRALHPQISWEAETVCLKAIDLDPRRRYQTAREFAEDLARVLDRQPIRASPAGLLLRGRRAVQRHPTWAVGAVLSSLCFVVAPLVFALYSQSLRHAAETTANALAVRTAEFEQLEHVVRLGDVQQSLGELPGWPDDTAALRAWLDQTWGPFAAELPAIERAIAHLEGRALSVSETAARFADPADRFLHQSLRGLVVDADEFATGPVTEVRARLAWSEQVGDLTLRHPNAKHSWDEASAAIRDANGETASALYQRDPPVEVAPQLGLVPLGMNPATGLWEFYHLRSAEDPAAIPEHAPETGHVEVDTTTGVVFVLIPGGTFAMGAQAADADAGNFDTQASKTEGPVHDVALDPFFVARHELTQGQWTRLSNGDNPSVYQPGNWQFRIAEPVTLAHPVEGVTWEASRAVLDRHGLRLPTEAQWEYACRAGTNTPWWTGAAVASLQGAANLNDATVARAGVPWGKPEPALDDGYLVHAPAGSLRANAFGLHHVVGNVFEWCADATLLYAKVPCQPGTGLRRTARPTKSRTMRGGSYGSTTALARGAFRPPQPPTAANGFLGLRAARLVRPAHSQ